MKYIEKRYEPKIIDLIYLMYTNKFKVALYESCRAFKFRLGHFQ